MFTNRIYILSRRNLFSFQQYSRNKIEQERYTNVKWRIIATLFYATSPGLSSITVKPVHLLQRRTIAKETHQEGVGVESAAPGCEISRSVAWLERSIPFVVFEGHRPAVEPSSIPPREDRSWPRCLSPCSQRIFSTLGASVAAPPGLVPTSRSRRPSPRVSESRKQSRDRGAGLEAIRRVS